MRRVVITGLGAVTPIGNDVDDFWSNLKNGVIGFDTITHFDPSNFKVKIAGEVKNYEVEKYIAKKEARRLDLFSQYAIGAAYQAFEDSGLEKDKIDKDRFGVYVGSGIGGLGTIEEQVIKKQEKGPDRVAAMFIPMAIGNMAAANIAIKLGAQGICSSIVTACATAANTIGEAFRNIKHGYHDIMVAGGAEASITEAGIAGFISLQALSTNTDKSRVSIPFDKERCGFVMGEGAGILILEELGHAEKRGAKIYGEIIGYGATCDAYHLTSPTPNGEGATKAMVQAMEEAGIESNQIDYINAHGTSTVINDAAETASIKQALGEHAYDIVINSTKSMTGHLLGGAGAIEAIAVLKQMEDNFLHPTVGLKVKDPACDLNYLPEKGMEKNIQYALSNSIGFGGHNASLCFKKWGN